MNILVGAMCVILMVLGAAELVRLLVFWWTKSLTEKKFTVVVSPESGEECECVLRTALERIHWLDLKGPCQLICLNSTGDEEIDKICRLLKLRYPCLRVCKPENLLYNLEETNW